MTFRTGRTILTVLKSITNNNATTVHFVSPRYIYTGVERFAERRKQISTGLMVHGFQNVKNKHKENFLTILHSYKSKIKEHQGCVDFIKTALKYMEEFGVHQDLETYKKLTEVMPKGKYVPLNLLQAMFQHYPLQQQTIVDLLDQMEYFGVMPDREMEDILLNIFGCQALPLRKYWRMMYWMPKFHHVNPWLLNDTILADPREMAKFALQKMTIADPSTKISMFDAKEIPDSIEDTWVASAISPVQEELLGALPETETLFVEGPYKVWIANHTIDYLVLRGEVINRSVIEIDEDDISNIQIPYHELKKVAVQYSIHEQTDGTYYAMCVSGTSSKDSALSWIRYLQNTNPILKKVAVVFKLKSSTGDEIVDQSNGTIQSKKQSEKKEGATER